MIYSIAYTCSVANNILKLLTAQISVNYLTISYSFVSSGINYLIIPCSCSLLSSLLSDYILQFFFTLLRSQQSDYTYLVVFTSSVVNYQTMYPASFFFCSLMNNLSRCCVNFLYVVVTECLQYFPSAAG